MYFDGADYLFTVFESALTVVGIVKLCLVGKVPYGVKRLSFSHN
jgi:hypothetical protein